MKPPSETAHWSACDDTRYRVSKREEVYRDKHTFPFAQRRPSASMHSPLSQRGNCAITLTTNRNKNRQAEGRTAGSSTNTGEGSVNPQEAGPNQHMDAHGRAVRVRSSVQALFPVFEGKKKKEKQKREGEGVREGNAEGEINNHGTSHKLFCFAPLAKLLNAMFHAHEKAMGHC